MADHPSFTERGPHEKGFAAVFDRDIAPRFEELERERLALFQQRKFRLLVTIAATAAGAIMALILTTALWSSFDSDQWVGRIFLLVFPVLLPFAIGLWWMKKLQKLHSSSLRGVIADAACEFFGDLAYERDPGDSFDSKRFIDLGVVPSGSFTRSEDLFRGRYRDTGYKMIDASVYRSSGRSGRTVFDGLLFEIEVPLEFSGRVLIGRDEGNVANALNKFFKGKFGKKEERVIFDHPAFEERYAVYASDPDEARRLITPGFCDTMVALAKTHDKTSLGAAFVDGVFLLAVPVAGDLFEPGSINRSVYDCEDDIHEFLELLTLAHRVIDYLNGDRPPVQGFEAGAEHQSKAQRERKKQKRWKIGAVAAIVFLGFGMVFFGAPRNERAVKTPAKIPTKVQIYQPKFKPSSDTTFAPYRLSLAVLESHELVASEMGIPLSPSGLRIDDTQADGAGGQLFIQFDVSGSRNKGTATTNARKCDGKWWAETVTIVFAEPVEPPLAIQIDIDIALPLAAFRRQVSSAGYAGLDAAAAYRDGQRIIDSYSGRFCDLMAARRLFFDAARAAPNGALAYIGMGRLAYKAAYISGTKYHQDGVRRSKEYLTAALEIDAASFDAYFYRAYAHLHSNSIPRAREDAGRARQLDSSSPLPDLLFADIAIREKKYDQAETKAKSVIAKTSDKNLIRNAYGVLKTVYRARKQYDLAEKTYLQIIELDPNSPWALVNYGSYLHGRGDYDEAITYGEKALTLADFGMGHRVVADAYYAKGKDLLWEQERYEASKKYFAGAIKHDASRANAHYGLGMAYYWTGYNNKNSPDLDQAEIYLRRALEIKPGHKQAGEALIQLRELFAWLEESGER